MKQELRNIWAMVLGAIALLLIVYSIIVVKLIKSGYIYVDTTSTEFSTSQSDNMVGILKVEGAIFSSELILKKIRKLRKKEKVKAVVLRLNSPGGGVAASQEIFEELKKLNKEKPLVVSMESLAASGAYYLAIAGKTIFANRGTITGSIGVIMQLAYLHDLYKLLRYEPITIKSGKYKDMGSPNRKLTKEERKFLQDLSDELHMQFIKDVSKQRRIPYKKLLTLAQGQVFTGEKAKGLGLIDKLGTYEDAIMYAAKLAGINDGYPKLYIPKVKTQKDGLLGLSLKTFLGLITKEFINGKNVYPLAR